jgi:hypothetical protein
VEKKLVIMFGGEMSCKVPTWNPRRRWEDNIKLIKWILEKQVVRTAKVTEVAENRVKNRFLY